MSVSIDQQNWDKEQALLKIRKILEYHDLIGIVTVVSETQGASYTIKLKTEWSQVEDTDGTISVKIPADKHRRGRVATLFTWLGCVVKTCNHLNLTFYGLMAEMQGKFAKDLELIDSTLTPLTLDKDTQH